MTNTPTSSLPQATTTKLPPATFTTTNLPPAPTSNTTSHLPPATSSTSHLLPSTSTARACNINEHMSTSTARACNINEADLFVVPVVGEENLLNKRLKLEELDDVTYERRCKVVRAAIKVEVEIMVSGKYEITKFVAKHNHQLLPKEYKHLTKKQRKMPQAEKNVVVRASTMN
ncbi:hypothetical protein Tco_0951509 [Tanacetum coccineum]|uniref:FAR1 domain-containing protein n=1 Tax=Tanacetum coccineum TaxID=301880 RepID=A0ABQ5E0D4_9ASTR